MFYDDKADYKSHLPLFLQDVVEIDVLENCINIQIDKLNSLIKDNVNNKSVSTANEQGVARWEKILGVTTPLNSTLQARREALKAKLMTKPPINMQTLKGIIEAYMGVQVDIVKEPNFVIKVWYRGTSRIADLNPLYATIYNTIPANLIIDIAYFYLTWAELDAQNLTWVELDAKNLTWAEFERGEWIV